jgi:hypothetical protein
MPGVPPRLTMQGCMLAAMQVPFVDVLSTMCLPHLPLTVHEYDEWGDPSIQTDFDAVSGPPGRLPCRGGEVRGVQATAVNANAGYAVTISTPLPVAHTPT